MTPQEKAKELVEKYFNRFHRSSDLELSWKECKQCALIAVDEIIKNIENYTEWSVEQLKLTRQYEFWEQVKEEIKKL